MGRGGAPELDDYPPLDIIPQTWGLSNTCPNQLASGTLHAQLFDLLSLLTFSKYFQFVCGVRRTIQLICTPAQEFVRSTTNRMAHLHPCTACRFLFPRLCFKGRNLRKGCNYRLLSLTALSKTEEIFGLVWGKNEKSATPRFFFSKWSLWSRMLW